MAQTRKKTKPAVRLAGLELRGKGIYLRPAALTDAPGLFRYIKDEAIVRYTIGIPHPYPRSAMAEFLKSSIKAMKSGTGYLFTIRRYDHEEPIGAIELMLNRRLPEAEIGYWLARKYWRQGIMTQTVKLILPFAFDQLKLHRLLLQHLSGNDASRRVIEKCWFRREGMDREVINRNGKWLHSVRYGLLDYEYRRIVARAQPLIPPRPMPAAKATEPDPAPAGDVKPAPAPKPKPARAKARK